MDIMGLSACMVVNSITVDSYGFLFDSATVCQASDSMTALTLSFNLLFGVWRLCLAGPTIAQLEVFYSSDYLWVIESYILGQKRNAAYKD